MGIAPSRTPSYRLVAGIVSCNSDLFMNLIYLMSCNSSQRSASKMNAMRKALLEEKARKGFAKHANAKARLLGVNLDFENPWHITKPEEWIFGPDPIEDNIYRCLPQVNLHGMDEGLTQKLNLGSLLYAIAEVGETEKRFYVYTHNHHFLEY